MLTEHPYEDVELTLKDKDGNIVHIDNIEDFSWNVNTDTIRLHDGRTVPAGGGTFKIEGLFKYNDEDEKEGWNQEGSNCPFGD